MVRFVIGHTENTADEKALAAEDRDHGGFLRLPIEVVLLSQDVSRCRVPMYYSVFTYAELVWQEGYTSLPSKTLSFLKLATRLFAAEYIVKVRQAQKFNINLNRKSRSLAIQWLRRSMTMSISIWTTWFLQLSSGKDFMQVIATYPHVPSLVI